MARSSSPTSLTVRLDRLTFRGRHGVLPEERRLGGPFQVDLKLEVEAPAKLTDRLGDTTDYLAAFARTRAVMEGRPFRTLEALTDAVAAALIRLPRVTRARVRVTKLAPPLTPGATSAVELTRARP